MMNEARQRVSAFLRGQAVSRVLTQLGIHPKRYWLLVDLFDELSERSEMLDQLGRNGVALKVVAWVYFGFSVLLTAMLLPAQPPVIVYGSVFLLLSTFLLLSVLLSETGNSLVNPSEGMVLVHHPINGATYTAAKLTHLLRIVAYLVPGLNLAPALGGVLLKDAPGFFPVAYMSIALVAGLLVALLCCATFGWLLRYVPPSRLKAAAQLAGALPMIAVFGFGQAVKWIDEEALTGWLPSEAWSRWSLAAAATFVLAAIVVFGIRSLSADYLIRISNMTRGGSRARANARRSGASYSLTRRFSGQAGVAAFAFVFAMMLRDWQFRRHIIPALIPMTIALAPALGAGHATDPFEGQFTPIHFLPHIFGVLLCFLCNFVAYSDSYKGAWMFLLAPSGAIRGFARGVYWMFWTQIVLIPHLVILPLLVWSWTVPHAMLFIAYSLAAASVYLSLELMLIDGVPFSKPVDPMRAAVQLPLLIIGGICILIAVFLQYFVLFYWPIAVVLATAALSLTALLVTRSSLRAFEETMRYNLSLMSVESGTLYKEVSV